MTTTKVNDKMKRYNIRVNIYGRILNEIDPDYFGTFISAWRNTLEASEEYIFKRTHNLDEKVMAYKATILENGEEVAFWSNDIKNAR
jgi:hypothetical protein